MSEQDVSRHNQPDPRTRPEDPAGTKPRVEAESLLPESKLAAFQASEPVVDAEADAVEIPLDDGELLPAKRAAATPAVAAPVGVPPHAGRFGFALGALLAIAAAGVMLAVLVISANSGDKGPSGPPWSDWQPSGSDGPQQIAAHVGASYRLPTGRQLVLVKSSPLQVSGVNLDIAEIRGGNSNDIKVVKGDNTVMYRMCGLATACSIPGTPSVNRALLIHREAVELALYTFHYTDAKGVVVIFPPTIKVKPGKQITEADLQKAQKLRTAAYFQRDQLKSPLKQPALTRTLTARTPSVNEASNWPDSTVVNGFVEPSLYTFSLTSGNTDDKGYLVLSRS